MITVLLTRQQLTVLGHARRGKRQRYQVCAAVSALSVAYRSYSDLPNGTQVYPRMRTEAFRFFVHALRGLAMRYPQNIKFEDAHDRNRPRPPQDR